MIYYLPIIFCVSALSSCYTTTPKYLFAPSSANLLQIEKKGDVKTAINYAQSKHVRNNDNSPGKQSSNGIDIQTAFSAIKHVAVKVDLFKKWEVDKALNNDQANLSRYKINYQRQGTVISIGYYKFFDKTKKILFNIDGGIGLGKTSFNGTYRKNAITKYFYSANNSTLLVTPSLKFKVSKNYNLTLAYRFSSTAFSKIITNDSTLTKDLYASFANKNSIYGDIIIENDFGFNSLQGIRFHWQLGMSNLYTHFSYEPSSSSQSFVDQYEYNNSFGSIGIVADLKKIFKK